MNGNDETNLIAAILGLNYNLLSVKLVQHYTGNLLSLIKFLNVTPTDASSVTQMGIIFWVPWGAYKSSLKEYRRGIMAPSRCSYGLEYLLHHFLIHIVWCVLPQVIRHHTSMSSFFSLLIHGILFIFIDSIYLSCLGSL
jgi:hypothetical protein